MAKRPVKVFIRKPIVKGVYGTCYVDQTGQITIEILPGRSDEKTLQTFIHEALHARFGHVTKPHKREVLPGELDVKSITGTNNMMSDHEMEVWQDLHFWRSVAGKYAHLYNGSWLEKRLKALWLQGDREPINPVIDRERIIQEAVKTAVDHVMRERLK